MESDRFGEGDVRDRLKRDPDFRHETTKPLPLNVNPAYTGEEAELWQKGQSRGHVQKVDEIRVDCDTDSLLYRVDQEDGACHTGYRSCFYETLDGETVGEQVFDPEEVYE